MRSPWPGEVEVWSALIAHNGTLAHLQHRSNQHHINQYHIPCLSRSLSPSRTLYLPCALTRYLSLSLWTVLQSYVCLAL